MRKILPPDGIDSLGKLNEWLAECGMPQRDCLDGEIGTPVCIEAEQWRLGEEFVGANRDMANEAHRTLITWMSQGLYTRMSYMDGKRLVWRIRPEITEEQIYRYLRPDGSEGDPVVDRVEDLTMIDTGNRAVKFYARFWLEPEA